MTTISITYQFDKGCRGLLEVGDIFLDSPINRASMDFSWCPHTVIVVGERCVFRKQMECRGYPVVHIIFPEGLQEAYLVL